ncbi:hypothetical protein PIROE2DRAFT_14800, partial [Piromyces sp. E2]
FFVPLNLPIASYHYTKFDKISTIIEVFWQRHYLVGLLLHEVFKTLRYKSDYINIKALNTLMYILLKHSFDPRYQEKEAQERIALMYFPMIIMSIDYLQETNYGDDKTKSENNNNIKYEHEKSYTNSDIKGDKLNTVDNKNVIGENNITNGNDEKNRLLGISLLYILQNVNESIRMNWIKKESLHRYKGFVLSLRFLIETFHFKGRDEIIKKYIKLSNASQCMNAKQLLEMRYKSNNPSNYEGGTERFRNDFNTRKSKIDKGTKSRESMSTNLLGSVKSQKLTYRSFTARMSGKPQDLGDIVMELSKGKEEFFNEVFLKMEGYLAAEVVLIILNITEDIMCDISQSSSTIELEPLLTLFNLYTFIFDKRHCQRTLLNMFISLKIFVNRFRHQIFLEKTPYCSQLCHIGIQYCCSSLPDVRKYCAGFLYLCMKLNYLEVRKNKIKTIEDLKEKEKNKNFKKNNISIKNKLFGLFGKPTNDNFSRSTPNLSLTSEINLNEDRIAPMHQYESKVNTIKTFTDLRKQSFISMKHTSTINSTSKIPDIKELDNQYSEFELLNSENAIGNFNKTKIQMMVALSKLDLEDNTNIKKSLATMKQYNKKDPYKSRSKQDPKYIAAEIEEQIDELMDRLYGITRDLVEIKKYEDDTEMKADYIHRVAIGFTAPDLRISFMERLKDIHINTKYLAEAAYCSLYTSKIIYNQLMINDLLQYDEIIPDNIWEKCFNNMNDPDDTDNIEDFSSDLISEQGFINTIKETCSLLSKAQLYEVCDYLYQFILPLYKNKKDYAEISKIYEELDNIYKSIDQGEQSGKRIFGIYYRIGFYGKAFKEIDGKEYIYKELGVTPLSEIFLKFNNLYKKKLGDNFKIIQDSNKVDISKLDPAINYIQITHVEPYFDDDENNIRQTYYERANGLNKFIFQTPYTKDGKAHGSV